MSSNRIGFATATTTLSGISTLRSFPSRDLTDIVLPSIVVIVPRSRVVVWASAAPAMHKPAVKHASHSVFMVSPRPEDGRASSTAADVLLFHAIAQTN